MRNPAPLRLFGFLVAAVVLGLSLAGCAGLKESMKAYTVTEEVDEFDGETTYAQKWNNSGLSTTYVNARAVVPQEGTDETRYEIQIMTEGGGVYSYGDRPLKLKIGGASAEAISLPPAGSQTDVVAASNVQKRGYYSIGESQLRRLSNASNAILRVYTAEGEYQNVELTEAMLSRMQDVLDKVEAHSP
jgi:hypothetical protein